MAEDRKSGKLNNIDPDNYLNNNSFNDLLILLKNPTKLIDYIFYLFESFLQTNNYIL